MSNNNDYGFPSGELRYPDLTEVEKKFLLRKKEDDLWDAVKVALLVLGILLFMTFLTWIYFQVPTVDTAHAQEAPVHVSRADYEFDVFCTQAVADHRQLHEKLTGNLKEVCGNYE